MIEGIQTKFLELARKGLSVRKLEETKHKLKFEKTYDEEILKQ